MSHWRDLLMLNKLRQWLICGFSSAFGSAFYTLFNPQIRILLVAVRDSVSFIFYCIFSF